MTAEEFRARYPRTHFIRTKSYIDRPDVELMRREFVPDMDTPEFPEIIVGRSKCYPLSETSFPNVLRCMSALEAGAWAVSKCFEQGWQICKGNIEACLANLDMDF